MFNKIMMIGNLTRDIELRYLPSGTAVANTAIASNRRFKNKMGEQQDETCFVDVAFFGRTAEIVNQYLKKGSKILVEGRLKQDQWTDQNGQKRSKHSIVVENMQMLDGKNEQPGTGGGYEQPYQQQQQQNAYNQPSYENAQPQQNVQQQPQSQPQQNIPEIDINEDEIPF
jgi:single-strand DNA-binding protein